MTIPNPIKTKRKQIVFTNLNLLLFDSLAFIVNTLSITYYFIDFSAILTLTKLLLLF